MLKRTQDDKGHLPVRSIARRSGAPKSKADSGNGVAGPVDLSTLPQSLGYVLRRAQLAVFKNFKATFDDVDITPAQYSVLSIIESNPGLKQTQVSDALGIKRANFVSLLDTLEARGLAERAPAADRRSYALFLTPSGRKLMKSLHALNLEHETRIAASIGPEQRAELLALLAAIIGPLETSLGQSSPGDDEV